LGALDFTLSKEHMERLDTVSNRRKPFPIEFVEHFVSERFNDASLKATRVGDAPKLWNKLY
jgi:hypothetical protein